MFRLLACHTQKVVAAAAAAAAAAANEAFIESPKIQYLVVYAEKSF
jgi:hypothetical protein